MEKFMLVIAALLSLAAFTNGAADMKMLKIFCADKLQQSSNDVDQCFMKPARWSSDGLDNAVLAYLCCLGVFGDVTHDYTIYTSEDLMRHFASITTESHVLDVADFILMCRDKNPWPGQIYLLTKEDYINWQRQGKTILSCRAPTY